MLRHERSSVSHWMFSVLYERTRCVYVAFTRHLRYREGSNDISSPIRWQRRTW